MDTPIYIYIYIYICILQRGNHKIRFCLWTENPLVVDQVHGRMSPLTGEQIQVVGAGGIFDGRGLAAALAMGCSGVWVGTRFIASDEASDGDFDQSPQHLGYFIVCYCIL